MTNCKFNSLREIIYQAKLYLMVEALYLEHHEPLDGAAIYDAIIHQNSDPRSHGASEYIRRPNPENAPRKE